MAIFSQPVEAVADINIFARMNGTRQILVIALRMTSSIDTSLVVPLPIAMNAGDSPVKFIDFSENTAYFAALRRGFTNAAGTRERRSGDEAGAPTMRYMSSGPYAEHFISDISDFESLDLSAQFPPELSGTFSPYLKYGFAVFQLRAGRNVRVKPMALEFETRHPDKLYFPTYEFSDGITRSSYRFDTVLFCQHAERAGWDETRGTANSYMQMDELQGILSPERLVQRFALNGDLPNEDSYQSIG
ncbi:MAG TPA: hypothetical protein EYN66_14715 [Myxococcales bacterium]|nr:hypothetical protein [Myxococcales bacterium]